jgi:hypothetical protein
MAVVALAEHVRLGVDAAAGDVFLALRHRQYVVLVVLLPEVRAYLSLARLLVSKNVRVIRFFVVRSAVFSRRGLRAAMAEFAIVLEGVSSTRTERE